MGSESLGCLDNKALNRSVLILRAGQSSDGRDLPLYPTLVSLIYNFCPLG